MGWLGIDLVTTNSCVYRVGRDGSGDVVASPTGETLTPSCVCVGPTEVLCGELARGGPPACTFFGFKRTIGRPYRDQTLWRTAAEWPFTIQPPPKEDEEPGLYCAWLDGEWAELTPNDLYVHLLRFMLRDVGPCDGVTVTVPAHFNTVQRAATKAALAKAGVPQCHVLNEPTAAAIAYLCDKPDLEGRVLVVDVGGGTIDCTLLECAEGCDVAVLGSDGTSEVGGEVVTDVLLRKVLPAAGIDRRDKAAVAELREDVERAKKALSLRSEATVRGDAVLTREDVDAAAGDMIAAVFALSSKVCADGPPPTVVVLCGGSTLMPAVRDRLKEMFPTAALSAELNPLTAVAKCAAFHARMQGAVVAAPDDAAAARPPREILTGGIVVRIDEDTMLALLEAGSRLPCRATRSFRMRDPGQTKVDLLIAQGNNAEVSLNATLGHFELPPGRVTVKLSVDTDGVVTVNALRPESGERLLLRKIKAWER